MRKIQKKKVKGKIVAFKYTPEMKQVISDNCTKSHQEICDLLKAQWPQWKFYPLSVKDIIKRLGLRIPKKPAQKQVVGDKIEYFSFTPEMEEIVKANYATKSNKEICSLLKARWPQWEFKVCSIKNIQKRLKLKCTRKQTAKIIRRNWALGVNDEGHRRTVDAISRNKKGDIFFCRHSPYYGKLVIKHSNPRKVRLYTHYLYEQNFGKIPNSYSVILKDPFGPIIPENLKLVRELWYMRDATSPLEDWFVTETLVIRAYSLERREELKNSPMMPFLIQAQRLQIQLLRAIKEAKDVRSATDTTDNQVEGTPEENA